MNTSSLARQTEDRLERSIRDHVAGQVGEAEADRLMELREATPHPWFHHDPMVSDWHRRVLSQHG